MDNGEVWLSSLDGAQKARLATHVVNSDGETEKWLDVAQSDGGRIVAVRNRPGYISNLSWFKIWEPDGTSTVEGPLNAPSGWTSYTIRSASTSPRTEKHLVYGYSNTSCCTTFGQGFYVRPASNSSLNPIDTTSQTHPALLGSRVIALDDSFSPSIISVQDADAGNPYTNTFTQWLDTTDVGYDLNRVDLAANGQLMALVFEEWDVGTQTFGAILLRSIQGVDQPLPDPAAVDCVLPADGVARDASLSQDAGAVAWKDGGGVKVAASPTTADGGPCAMASAPAVLSLTGSIRRSVAPPWPRSCLAAVRRAGSAPARPPGPGGPGAAAPVVTLPAKVTAKALAKARGVPVKVKVAGPGTISVRGTVPARRLGRRGNPVVVAKGGGTRAQRGP